MPEIDPTEARRRIDAGEAVLVDVRESEEWDAGHAPDALHRPLGDLDPAEFAGRSVITTCRGGDAGRVPPKRFTRPASMPSACTVACGAWARTAGRSCAARRLTHPAPGTRGQEPAPRVCDLLVR